MNRVNWLRRADGSRDFKLVLTPSSKRIVTRKEKDSFLPTNWWFVTEKLPFSFFEDFALDFWEILSECDQK